MLKKARLCSSAIYILTSLVSYSFIFRQFIFPLIYFLFKAWYGKLWQLLLFKLNSQCLLFLSGFLKIEIIFSSSFHKTKGFNFSIK